MSGGGIEPSNKGRGYRLRQYSKYLSELLWAEREDPSQIFPTDLIEVYHQYWSNFFEIGRFDSSFKIKEKIEIEFVRSWNGRILEEINRELKNQGKSEIYVEINQPYKSFLRQIRISLGKEICEKFNFLFCNG